MVDLGYTKCPIWLSQARVSEAGDCFAVYSERAGGNYLISRSVAARTSTLDLGSKAKLTSWIAEQHYAGEHSPLVTSIIVDQACARPPLTVLLKRNRALQMLASNSKTIGQDIKIFGAEDDERKRNKTVLQVMTESEDVKEALAMVRFLAEDGLAQIISDSVFITFRGWRYLEDMNASRSNSQQAFVAMWFDESMQAAFVGGIEPAIKACGYMPVRIDNKEHIGKIDDEIISEIRRSKFVVADFTSAKGAPRGGVYFEAGFAMGLNIPVVWTCRDDMIGDVHFDTRQFNHIVWSNPQDLKDRLKKRIGAVIGDGPLPKVSDGHLAGVIGAGSTA